MEEMPPDLDGKFEMMKDIVLKTAASHGLAHARGLVERYRQESAKIERPDLRELMLLQADLQDAELDLYELLRRHPQ